VRGGGGNFGVVTSFEYQLHPVGPIVVGGMVLHPLSQAKEVLRFYREFTASAPDALTTYAGLLTSPEGMPVVAIAACYAGAVEDGERAVAPIKAFGTPVADMMGPLPYTAQQMMLDPAVPAGRHSYWKSQFLRELPDAVIDAAVAAYERVPSSFSVVIFEHSHGAINRVPPEATAFSQRTSPYDMVILSLWEDPDANEANIGWARDLFAAARPFASGVYVNGLSGDEGDRTQEAYGPNYDRLVAVKNRYDPTNFFRGNQNIAPTT
jgi:FAD/FMN-containing dehydrogenase